MVSQRYLAPVPEQSPYSAELVAALQALLPNWTPDVTDPGVYWSDDTAARLIALIKRFNDSADANYILRAKGQALTELVAQYGIMQRLPGEDDDALLLRFQQQWESITAGTPAWDILATFRADPLVASVGRSLVDWAANMVTIWTADQAGNNLPAQNRQAIQERLNHPERPTFWLDYQVEEAEVRYYLVSGRIVYDSRTSDPIVEVKANLEAAIASLRKLNVGIDDSYLSRFSWAPNVQRIEYYLHDAKFENDEFVVGDRSMTVPAYEAAPNIVRHGLVAPQVQLPGTTKALIGIGGESEQAASSVWAATGTVDALTYNPAQRQAGNYIWVRIDAPGDYRNMLLNLVQPAGQSVQMEQFGISGEVALLRSRLGDAALLQLGQQCSISGTRDWPDIRSSTRWDG